MRRSKIAIYKLLIVCLILVGGLSNAFAQISTRVLTIKTAPNNIELQSVFIDGQRAKIISSQSGYSFVEVRADVNEFRCKYTLSVIAENGRFLRKKYDLCEEVWQIDVDFADDGAGTSKKQISIVPSDPEVRIYSLAVNGKPQSFTAFIDSNRIEFTLRRGPSGYKCSAALDALLSNGNRFKEQVDLCANNNEVVLDLEPERKYFEVLTIRSTIKDDRISSVRVDGRKVPILRWITNGVRTRLAAGADSFKCDAKLEVDFASGAKAAGTMDICAENFDVTLTPAAQYKSDTNMSASFAWRFIAPKDANDMAVVEHFSRSGRKGFVAVCEPGSRNATVYVTGFPVSADFNSRLKLQSWAGQYKDTREVRIGRSPIGNKLSGPSFSLSTKNGLWNGLISGSAYTLIADEEHRLRLSLKGSAGPVREFVRACNQQFYGPSVSGDVTNDSSLKWTKPRQSNGGHRLVFGDLGTDRIGLDARCDEGEGFAQVMFASAPTDLSQNTSVEVFWDTVGNQGTQVARTRNVPNIDWGTVPVAQIEMNDGFWASLAGGNIVHIAMDGRRMATYSLKGSATPVRQFVDACRQYVAEPEPRQPLTPDQPTREEQVFDSIIDIFNGISERSNGGIQIEIESSNAGADRALQQYRNNPNLICTDVVLPQALGGGNVNSSFINQSASPVDLFQVAANGQRIRVRDIPSGARLSVDAPQGQSWEVRRRNGGCVTSFVSPRQDVEFLIKQNMGEADPGAFAKSYQCDGRQVQVVVAPNHGFAIIDGRYAVHRAKVSGRAQDIWGDMSASISDQQLVVRGGDVPDYDCTAN
ncbi:hypothetical protein [Maritalea sp.]|uniref:hypothetical protein n=1 Tax=Maritalea sp. TaxID=2003361 RepID=UPI003EF6BD0F